MKAREGYLKKYCNPKKSQGLELQEIKQYGRQILEVRLKEGNRTRPPPRRPLLFAPDIHPV